MYKSSVLVGFAAVLWLTVVGGVIYIVIHFAIKFW